MISNQILQSTIDGLKAITKREITVMDVEGNVLATTDAANVGMHIASVPDLIHSKAESMLIQGYQYFKVFDERNVEYVISTQGSDEEDYKFGKVAAFQIQSLLVAYKERFDKDNFIKNLLLDNMLLVDIYTRAKKLRIENNVRRLVYLVETHADKDTHASLIDVMHNLFPTKSRDYITAVDENSIILVKEVQDNDTQEAYEKTARSIADTLGTEVLSKVRVSMGSVVSDLKDISKSYKEAKMALDVGKIFYSEKNVVSYSSLGIGRLIYQLPLSLCKMYIEEIFHNIKLSDFDEETLNTISKFFENSLNVSETSRQLYIHRNTLVYRLDKLQKNTGLDIRVFEDAITFKIALMVAKYMEYMEKNDY
ncbi:MAG: helix-turn-helix domain-containing protein [Firmicutes bacterium]|nr:helix-turn-helix domain-containing protein [Bacillota bacterium]